MVSTAKRAQRVLWGPSVRAPIRVWQWGLRAGSKLVQPRAAVGKSPRQHWGWSLPLPLPPRPLPELQSCHIAALPGQGPSELSSHTLAHRRCLMAGAVAGCPPALPVPSLGWWDGPWLVRPVLSLPTNPGQLPYTLTQRCTEECCLCKEGWWYLSVSARPGRHLQDPSAQLNAELHYSSPVTVTSHDVIFSWMLTSVLPLPYFWWRVLQSLASDNFLHSSVVFKKK